MGAQETLSICTFLVWPPGMILCPHNEFVSLSFLYYAFMFAILLKPVWVQWWTDFSFVFKYIDENGLADYLVLVKMIIPSHLTDCQRCAICCILVLNDENFMIHGIFCAPVFACGKIRFSEVIIFSILKNLLSYPVIHLYLQEWLCTRSDGHWGSIWNFSGLVWWCRLLKYKKGRLSTSSTSDFPLCIYGNPLLVSE